MTSSSARIARPARGHERLRIGYSSRALVRRLPVWSFLAFAPLLIVFYANITFVRNHFYAHTPYLFDSGWFSYTVFRQGLLPRNPPGTAGPIIYYWGWHISLAVSAGSMLSYVFPGDRVDWYAVFQGLIAAPLACAVPLLVRRDECNRVRSAAITAAASLLFTFSGQALACMAYPHFEVLSGAGVAIMLGALATANERVAWIGLATSIGTREDGGMHAAMFLVAVLACDLLRRPFPVPRGRVIAMTAIGFGATALMVTAQKKLFVGPNAWEIYLVGKPPFAHLSWGIIVHRLGVFATRVGMVWVPVVATMLVAIHRRDPRYLFGWVVSIPWFVLNFTAKQELKSAFSVYTGFPFIGSAFFAAAYARVEETRAPSRGWTSPLGVAAFVSMASFIGLFAAYRAPVEAQLGALFIPEHKNASGLRAFARDLRARAYGDVRMDDAAAAWAIEAVSQSDIVTAEEMTPGSGGDAWAFWASADALGALAGSPFTNCGRVPETHAFLCTRRDRPLPVTVVASSPWVERAIVRPPRVRRDGETIVVEAESRPDVRVFGPYVRLRPGHYVASWDIELQACSSAVPPLMHVDVFRGGKSILAWQDVVSVKQYDLRLPFEATPETAGEAIELRASSGSCGYRIRRIDLRRLD